MLRAYKKILFSAFSAFTIMASLSACSDQELSLSAPDSTEQSDAKNDKSSSSYKSSSSEKHDGKSSSSKAESSDNKDPSNEEGNKTGVSSSSIANYDNLDEQNAKDSLLALQFKEALSQEKKKVSGSCAPSGNITAGGSVVWTFNRTEGSLAEMISAPFSWLIENDDKQSYSGNGLSTISATYSKPGLYHASLNVDGNKIDCTPLRVQGFPVTVSSCTANKPIAYTGDTITWTVAATSEVKISSYKWNINGKTIETTSPSLNIKATESMSSLGNNPVVAVSNEDFAEQSSSCDKVHVVDSSKTDFVLGIGDLMSPEFAYKNEIIDVPDSMVIKKNIPTVIELPKNISKGCTIGCKPQYSLDYMTLVLTWGGEELVNFAYFTPKDCTPGTKVIVTATENAICMVNGI